MSRKDLEDFRRESAETAFRLFTDPDLQANWKDDPEAGIDTAFKVYQISCQELARLDALERPPDTVDQDLHQAMTLMQGIVQRSPLMANDAIAVEVKLRSMLKKGGAA